MTRCVLVMCGLAIHALISCGADQGILCGDGLAGAGEQCDDGNAAAGDGCTPECTIEYCGNSSLDVGEACDDGNTMSGDGCASDCYSAELCGNGVVDVAIGEACDDGNTIAGDGCEADCHRVMCGDGIHDPGEVCDDGNHVSGDGCSAACTSTEVCGNGIVDHEAGEQCEPCPPGSMCDEVIEECSETCRLMYCGNGIVDPGEACDDGNTTSGDGCDPTCQVTPS